MRSPDNSGCWWDDSGVMHVRITKTAHNVAPLVVDGNLAVDGAPMGNKRGEKRFWFEEEKELRWIEELYRS